MLSQLRKAEVQHRAKSWRKDMKIIRKRIPHINCVHCFRSAFNQIKKSSKWDIKSFFFVPFWWGHTWKAYSFPIPWDAPVTTKTGRNKLEPRPPSAVTVFFFSRTLEGASVAQSWKTLQETHDGIVLVPPWTDNVSLCSNRTYCSFGLINYSNRNTLFTDCNRL